jgi:hypothetical protein
VSEVKKSTGSGESGIKFALNFYPGRKKMRNLKYALVFLMLPVLMTGLLAAQKNYRVIGSKEDFYFGHVTYLEPVDKGETPVIQSMEGEELTEAILNLPLLPGDTVFSRDGRLELQFDNGTIIRLDRNTELLLQTVLAPTLSSGKKVSNIVLNHGSIYVMYKEYDSSELFQVLTHKSAVKLDHNSVSIIRALDNGSSEVVVRHGQVWLMVPPAANKKEPQEIRLEKDWRAEIAASGEVQAGRISEADEFLAWNERINADFDAYHEASVLPKPLQSLPPAIFYFAQRYGSIYGEWIWHDLYGYVWRPYYNDYYPWGSWMPYIYGRWQRIGNNLFWIPEEPWGWVPYHLGFWMWDKNKGWIWIPGSLFAPAWAVWDFFYGYYAWRPWTLFDWYFSTFYDYFGYNQALSGYYYNFYYQVMPQENVRPILDKIRKDQLKKPGSEEKISPPKEIKRITEVVLNALKRGDPEAMESLRRTLTSFVMVPREDFKPDFSREKVMRLEEAIEKRKIELSPSFSPPNRSFPAEIMRTLGRLERAVSDKGKAETPKVLLPEKAGNVERISLRGEAVAGSGRMKIVDWNPDVRIARRMGLDIVYDSQRNEVRCPQLGYGSRDLVFRRMMLPSPEGGFRMISNPFASGSFPSSMNSPSSSGFAGGAERIGSSSPARESGSGRSGEKK